MKDPPLYFCAVIRKDSVPTVQVQRKEEQCHEGIKAPMGPVKETNDNNIYERSF